MTKEEFNNEFPCKHGDEHGQLHDTIFNAWGTSESDERCLDIFLSVPELIQQDAIEWGLSDTVFRDNFYTYIRDNKLEILTRIE